MSEKLTIIKNLDKLPKDKTDWSKVRNMTEEEIVAAAKSDPDAQLITAKELREARRVHPPKKVNVKKIRESLHLTQEEFAACFGISERTFSNGNNIEVNPAP